MKCNSCKFFSIEKLKIRANNKNYYFILLLKCTELNIILEIVKEERGLENIFIPDVSPAWDCSKLQELRKKDKAPHFELSIANGYLFNDFTDWIKNN